jgi:hypothetical protein
MFSKVLLFSQNMASESTVNSEHSMVHQNQGIVRKKKLVIVGSSHAKRMFLHFIEKMRRFVRNS